MPLSPTPLAGAEFDVHSRPGCLDWRIPVRVEDYVFSYHKCGAIAESIFRAASNALKSKCWTPCYRRRRVAMHRLYGSAVRVHTRGPVIARRWVAVTHMRPSVRAHRLGGRTTVGGARGASASGAPCRRAMHSARNSCRMPASQLAFCYGSELPLGRQEWRTSSSEWTTFCRKPALSRQLRELLGGDATARRSRSRVSWGRHRVPCRCRRARGVERRLPRPLTPIFW